MTVHLARESVGWQSVLCLAGSSTDLARLWSAAKTAVVTGVTRPQVSHHPAG